MIAQQAVEPRDSARLLVSTPQACQHRRFYDLPELLRPEDLLVINRTRVIPARLFGQKHSGGQVEVLLVHPADDDQQCWQAMIRGKVRPGTVLSIDSATLEVTACHADGSRTVRFADACDVLALCDRVGHVPLPPYIKRPDQHTDRERYQSVFAQTPGSVAAPTASLHFTTAVLAACRRRGIAIADVELRVGPGTFKPVQVEQVSDHPIHAEWCHCPAATVQAIAACRQRGGRVVAVGTTVVRTLESAARHTEPLTAWSGWTRLYLHPPQQLQVVDALLTNFHLPRSTLLMLVACLTGLARLHHSYQQALHERYRLFSYGDAMLVLP